MSHADDHNNFEKFLLAEYNNISQAHYDTGRTIATFFQYYLLIVGIPISLLTIFKPLPLPTDVSASGATTATVMVFAVGVLVVISLAGSCVFGYVTNLRLDALLYARTVNGIRAYFYDVSAMPLRGELHMRALPRTMQQPRYAEPRYFLYVVLTFMLLNGAYAAAAVYLLTFFVKADVTWVCVGLVYSFLLIIAHPLAYWQLLRYREHRYLRTRHIGVDIDGVLNRQRQHFCYWIEQLHGLKIDPEAIARIPVSECEALAINREQEQEVFQHVEYWHSLPPDPEAAEVLRELKEELGFKIHIFSYRPAPDKRRVPKAKWPAVKHAWKGRSIRRITLDWLARHNFSFNHLVVEKGDVYTTAPVRWRSQNRFIYSAKHEVRIFVEDNLDNALKLSRICEIVFLVDHPYNQAEEQRLPHNIIRVCSWREIKTFVRTHL